MSLLLLISDINWWSNIEIIAHFWTINLLLALPPLLWQERLINRYWKILNGVHVHAKSTLINKRFLIAIKETIFPAMLFLSKPIAKLILFFHFLAFLLIFLGRHRNAFLNNFLYLSGELMRLGLDFTHLPRTVLVHHWKTIENNSPWACIEFTTMAFASEVLLAKWTQILMRWLFISRRFHWLYKLKCKINFTKLKY